MRKFTSTLIAGFIVAAGFVVAVPVAAQAGSPNCVSRAEFRRVKAGMPKARVHRIFDIRGKRDSISTYRRQRDEYRTYRVCRGWGNPRWSDVSINFDNYLNPRAHRGGMRVYSKSSYITR